jgi:4-nitrophenyl phosphatase
MYAGSREITYAKEFIEYLKQSNIPFLYVTNNSTRTPLAVADHLQQMGINAKEEEIVTSSQAAAQYVAELGGQGARVFAVGEEGLRIALMEAGLQLVAEQPDFVVQGLDRNFSYEKLNKAAAYIRAGAAYLLTNPDQVLPYDDTLLPGAGSLSASIQMASGVEPVIIGKPSHLIVQYALKRLPQADEVWVVGDNLLTDIGAGHAAGLRTALVLTGLATPDNVEGLIQQYGIVPDLIASHLMELIHTIEQRID